MQPSYDWNPQSTLDPNQQDWWAQNDPSAAPGGGGPSGGALPARIWGDNQGQIPGLTGGMTGQETPAQYAAGTPATLTGTTKSVALDGGPVKDAVIPRAFGTDANGYFPPKQNPDGTWSYGGQDNMTIGQLASAGLATAGFPEQFAAPTKVAPDAFTYAGFKAPDAASVENDPGWQYTRDQELGAVDRSAAGRGLLGSSGTLTDVATMASNLANQHYGDVFNRGLTSWQNNAANAKATFDTGTATDTANYGNAWQKYLSDLGIFTSTQDRNFDKTLKYAQA